MRNWGKKIAAASVIGFGLMFGTVQAQIDDVPRTTTVRDDADESNWGWLGLAGLIGLAGLAGRNQHSYRTEHREAGHATAVR